MQCIKNNTIRIEKIFSLLIVLLPFLYQYKGYVYISLGELLLLPFIFYFFINETKIKSYKYKSKEYLFYFYIIFSSSFCLLFEYFKINDALTLSLRMVYYALLLKEATCHFNWKSVSKIYENIVFFFSLYLILQVIYNNLTNRYLPIYIKYDWLFPPEQRAKDLIEYYRWSFRASSLFLEPSYYALYCMPFLCIKILKENKTIQDNIKLIVVTFANFLSGANSGIIGIVILFFYFIFYKLKKSKIGKLSYIVMFFLTISFIILFYFWDFKSGGILERIQKGGSLNQRVIRGIIIFKELGLFHKIFGLGINNVEAYMLKNSITTPFDELLLNYMCSFLQTLNFSGIVGFIFLLNYIFAIWKKIKNNLISRGIFLILIFIMSYEAILFSYRFAFLFIIMEAISKRECSCILKDK